MIFDPHEAEFLARKEEGYRDYETASMLRAAAREITAMRKAIDEVIAVEGGNRTGLGVAIARLKHVREVHQ